jgi:hypothetical protein
MLTADATSHSRRCTQGYMRDPKTCMVDSDLLLVYLQLIINVEVSSAGRRLGAYVPTFVYASARTRANRCPRRKIKVATMNKIGGTRNLVSY